MIYIAPISRIESEALEYNEATEVFVRSIERMNSCSHHMIVMVSQWKIKGSCWFVVTNDIKDEIFLMLTF